MHPTTALTLPAADLARATAHWHAIAAAVESGAQRLRQAPVGGLGPRVAPAAAAGRAWWADEVEALAARSRLLAGGLEQSRRALLAADEQAGRALGRPCPR